MPKEVYFNKPQRLTQLIGANISVIVAGRRTGKTDSIAAPFVLRNMQRMPGSTGGIVVPTFKLVLQILCLDCSRHGSDGAIFVASIMSSGASLRRLLPRQLLSRQSMSMSYLFTMVHVLL